MIKSLVRVLEIDGYVGWAIIHKNCLILNFSRFLYGNNAEDTHKEKENHAGDATTLIE